MIREYPKSLPFRRRLKPSRTHLKPHGQDRQMDALFTCTSLLNLILALLLEVIGLSTLLRFGGRKWVAEIAQNRLEQGAQGSD